MAETHGRSSEDIVIRAIADRDDFKRSLTLLSLFFDGQLPGMAVLENGYETAIAYGYNQFIAELGQEIVGSISIKPIHDPLEAGLVYEINHLIVAPAYRRMGIGSALMEKCHSHARRSGAIGIRLLSYNADTQAQAFYAEKGYQSVCQLMIKPLQH